MAHFPQLFQVPQPAQLPSSNGQGQDVTALPLNLIAIIISYLDNVADLARVCQTSRVLHYMTLPQLYKNIKLVSYDTIRYKDDQPEGVGSASPFSMGLNALVTRNVAALVRTLTLQGNWREHDLKEYSMVGRVPDDSMMLNIAIRAAVDRCVNLERFKWDLSTKLLPNVYGGLSGLQHLTHLHLRFPSSRCPRPTSEIPPMPNLRSFTMTDYDPLCFPDDTSTLLFHATKLTALKLHFSPRMRAAGEPSVQLIQLLRKNIAKKRKLKLKTFGIYNLFAYAHPTEMAEAIDIAGIENMTFLNFFGGDDAGRFTFFDNSWMTPPTKPKLIRSQRHDRLHKSHAKMLHAMTGMERLYLVNARYINPVIQNGNETGNGVNGQVPSPSSAETTPSSGSTAGTPLAAPNLQVRDMYLDGICHSHGATLRHLILPARWPLPTYLIARLFRACPHITQLSIAMECASWEGMRMLVPFLTKLWAIRLLEPENGDEGLRKEFLCMVDREDDKHESFMGRELAKGNDFPELRYVGIGMKVWEVGGVYEEVEEGEDGVEQVRRRRRLRRVGVEEVQEVEIWRMDSLDVV